jgi:hypothetical protein
MKELSKSAIVRRFLAKGFTPAQITAKMGLPRNFVYQVQFVMRKKEKAGTANELPLDHPIFEKKQVLLGSGIKKRVKGTGANAVQVGGTHYKAKGIQPWDAIVAWKMGFLDGNAVKYLCRFRDKGGVEDLQKAAHYIDKLIEVETNKEK